MSADLHAAPGDGGSDGDPANVGDDLAALAEQHRSLLATLRTRLRASALGAVTPSRPGRPMIVTSAPDRTEALLAEAVDGLATRMAAQSSKQLVDRNRGLSVVGFVLVNIVAAMRWPVGVAIGWIALITVVYAATIVDRVLLYVRSLDDAAIDIVTDEEARAVPDDELPVFTVLVPAYHEPEVIQHLLRAVGGLEYPPAKLDVKLLLEHDDEATIEAATAVALGVAVDVVLVPAAEPRTKPKALNYGLQLASGDIVTVYDAEDVPDPLQLRRAAVVFSRCGDEVACVQAQLSFSNVHQNVLTRWFTLEYAMWFSLFLPGLVASGAPVPLGGTSNHFRRPVLEELAAWDPYNVTEDADLGIRLHRRGYRTRVMQSVTLEEANSDFVNWVKQRSRWYKGYLQTWLVHLRRPGELRRELGFRGFLRFNLFVGGTPVLAALNPVFWLLTVMWFVMKPPVIHEIFPAPVFYLGLTCWAIGNFTIAYLWIVATRLTKRTDLLFAALIAPAYWMMMGIGVAKAMIQLVISPSYWEKTTHGLHQRVEANPHAVPAVGP